MNDRKTGNSGAELKEFVHFLILRNQRFQEKHDDNRNRFTLLHRSPTRFQDLTSTFCNLLAGFTLLWCFWLFVDPDANRLAGNCNFRHLENLMSP